MNQQVITIGKDGSLAGLQHKKGSGVDLRAFGKASITRASEVLWDEDGQKWYVEFRKGANELLEGVKLTIGMHRQKPRSHQRDDEKVVALFDEYDIAVKAEIRYLNWIRANNIILK